MNVPLRERHLYAELSESKKQIVIQHSCRRKNVTFINIHHKAQDNGAVSQFIHAKILWQILHHVAVLIINLLHECRNGRLEVLQVRPIRNANVADAARHLVRPVQDILHGRVIDNLDVLRRIRDAGCTNTYIRNSATEPVHFNNIAHVIMIFKDHERTRDHVCDQALRTKANDQGYDPDAGNDGGYVDAKNGKTPA